MPDGPYSSGLTGDLGGRMARLMFYIMLAVVLMTLDYRGHHVNQIRAVAALAVEPIFLTIEAPFVLAVRLRENVADRRELRNQRNELERLLLQSRAELLLKEALGRENAELRELLAASAALDTRFNAVELRNIDLNPYSHRVLINRGSRHGLQAGQPVVDAHGVVGQVDHTMLHSASVILLSDPDHALPVLVERTRLRTIAYGSGRSDRLRLTDLPMNVDLNSGDRLVTSGLGGRFPPGLPVAEVVSISRPAGEAFASAMVRPLARLDGARHLLVLAVELEEPMDVQAETNEPDEPDAAPEVGREAVADDSEETRADPVSEEES